MCIRDSLNMGLTAERLHDRFPELTKERADRFGMLSQQKVQACLLYTSRCV